MTIIELIKATSANEAKQGAIHLFDIRTYIEMAKRTVPLLLKDHPSKNLILWKHVISGLVGETTGLM